MLHVCKHIKTKYSLLIYHVMFQLNFMQNYTYYYYHYRFTNNILYIVN